MRGDAAPLEIEVLGADASAAAVDEWLAVRNALDVRTISRASFELRRAAEISALRLGARRDGRLAAVAAVAWDVVRLGIDEATVQIYVLPEHRGRGIGSALWARASSFARDGGIGHVVARVVSGDAASLEFAEHRGLTVTGMQQLGTLDIDASHASTKPAPPAGVTIEAMGDRPELHHAIYEHLVSVLPEVPSWGDAPLPSFDAWQTMTAEPAYRKDLSLIALDGDSVVGQIDVDDDGEGGAFIGMLTVAPSARRRGIARALKQELAHRAATAGWKVLVTVNDGTNDAIRRLNEDLGYRYLPEVLVLHGPVPPT